MPQLHAICPRHLSGPCCTPPHTQVCGATLTRSEVVDSTLRECFTSAAGEQDMWRSLEAAQAMGESCMVEKALLLHQAAGKSTSTSNVFNSSSGSNLGGRSSGSNLLSRSSTGKQLMFDLSFRPGGSSVVDELSLVVNIPSMVAMDKELQVTGTAAVLTLPVLLACQQGRTAAPRAVHLA